MSSTVATTTRDMVTVSGPDAATYLQGQLSQDVSGMDPGETKWTFVLAPQGKVEGWGRIHRLDDERFSIMVDAGAGEAWDARLQRFLLRTKAEIDVAPGVAVVSVRGEGSEALVGSLTGAAGAGWRPSEWPGVEGLDRVSGADHREVADALESAGATPAEDDRLEAIRIRAGVPRWGAEVEADTIPATLGQWAIDGSVNFTKGCYTGQELVARIDSRGGNVPRVLHGLVVDGQAPRSGAPVEGVEGETAGAIIGAVTSSAYEGTGSVALLFVGRATEVPDDGLPVTVDGVPALVVRIPF